LNDPPKITPTEVFEEDMVNAYIHSIEDFNDCSIEEVYALKKEL